MPTTQLTYLDLLTLLSPHPKPVDEIIYELTGACDVEAHAQIRELRDDAAEHGFKIQQVSDASARRCWALDKRDYHRLCKEMGLE